MCKNYKGKVLVKMSQLPSTQRGYLEIFMGPMFSGKTTRLVQLYDQFTYIGKRVAVVNFVGDTRYHDTMMATHNKTMIPCIQLDKLTDAWLNPDGHLQLADVILINEGQFFSDLKQIVLDMVESHKKHVYIAGLDADFQRNPFGQLFELIPYCDSVVKLHAFCSICRDGTPAIHSLRTVKDQQQVLIGSDMYKPVCRECYRNHLAEEDELNNFYETISKPISEPNTESTPSNAQIEQPITPAITYKVGDRIISEYTLWGEVPLGKIVGVRNPEEEHLTSYDILYDDGAVELNVKNHKIKLANSVVYGNSSCVNPFECCTYP